jgi:hypothetical protein
MRPAGPTDDRSTKEVEELRRKSKKTRKPQKYPVLKHNLINIEK